jgi:hypothetical protein
VVLRDWLKSIELASDLSGMRPRSSCLCDTPPALSKDALALTLTRAPQKAGGKPLGLLSLPHSPPLPPEHDRFLTLALFLVALCPLSSIEFSNPVFSRFLPTAHTHAGLPAFRSPISQTPGPSVPEVIVEGPRKRFSPGTPS